MCSRVRVSVFSFAMSSLSFSLTEDSLICDLGVNEPSFFIGRDSVSAFSLAISFFSFSWVADSFLGIYARAFDELKSIAFFTSPVRNGSRSVLLRR